MSNPLKEIEQMLDSKRPQAAVNPSEPSSAKARGAASSFFPSNESKIQGWSSESAGPSAVEATASNDTSSSAPGGPSVDAAAADGSAAAGPKKVRARHQKKEAAMAKKAAREAAGLPAKPQWNPPKRGKQQKSEDGEDADESTEPEEKQQQQKPPQPPQQQQQQKQQKSQQPPSSSQSSASPHSQHASPHAQSTQQPQSLQQQKQGKQQQAPRGSTQSPAGLPLSLRLPSDESSKSSPHLRINTQGAGQGDITIEQEDGADGASPKDRKKQNLQAPQQQKKLGEGKKAAQSASTGDLTPRSKGNRKAGGHLASRVQYDDPKKVAKIDKQAVLKRTKVQKVVSLFSHLPQYERETSVSLKVGFSSNEIHPAILRLGLRYAEGSISGSNARCVAMMTALKQFIMDYKTPPEKVLSRDLDNKLKPLIRFLIDCRPQAMSMGNAIRFLKVEIARIPPTMPESQAKELLCQKIDEFVQERIEFSDTIIAQHGVSRINDGDVIMTYATSHVVERILKQAHDAGKKFRVIVVDSRPKLEGKILLKRLVEYGLSCTYILINAVSYVIKSVSKVMFGAYAMLANGTVVSRVGSAVVAMMAHTFKVPVLVCCETYKFHERVQLESISFNELGDPDDLISVDRDDARFGDVLQNWRDIPALKLVNLVYDLTPVQYVSLVITEVGMIPPTSVSVILREYHKNS